ncbi:nicotinate-nucleotide adenylyltransferase [Lacticaseibacillus mingshuiensis]|uniref:Probable nicotinate-nucleotide adenylyltransferase n=1 Tax=Lacticaseibacillus mingshuiensis TaxID=2799574 RepID=A0ABW4CJF5_9LACO|nr:nicotinate-nucleotide adenylyltransferase [Lacticaseibacillus mingshuiensis]
MATRKAQDTHDAAAARTTVQPLTRPAVHAVIEEEVTAQPLAGKRRQVGIFGGTFNPIHIGHLIMAEAAGTQLGLSQVLFLPDNQPPHVDKKEAIAARDRVAMVESAIKDNPLFGLELAEIRRGGVSYTVDTMRALTHLHPDIDYYFIIGADMVAYLPKWHAIDELAKLVTFVGVKRRGYAPQSPYPIVWVDAPLVDISSTQIRQRLACGLSIRYLVPDGVRHYIEEKGLYRG